MKNKSMFKNSIYKAILTIVNIVIPLFVGPYIARVLDKELFGIYNNAYSQLQFFLVFAGFGVYNYGIREISKVKDNPKKLSKLFTDLFVISLVSNLLMLLIFIIYSFVVSNGITTTIYLLISLQIVANIFYIEFVNEAFENYNFITIKGVLVKILYFVLLLSFVKKPDDILMYALIIGLIVILNNLISYIYIRKRLNFNFKQIEIKKYIKPLLYSLLINNVTLLYVQLDKVMLGAYDSNVSVTVYYIAYYIVSTIAYIPTSMVSVAIPRMSYLLNNVGKKESEEVLNKIISAFLYFVIPMSIGMFVLSKEIIYIYGSEKYMAAVIPFALMCTFRITTSLGNSLVHLVFYPAGEERKYIKYALIFGICNIIFNSTLVIIGVLNPITAFLTTGICETLLFLTEYIYVRRKMKLNVMIISRNHIKYLITSLFFIPITFLVKQLHYGVMLTTLLVIVPCCLLYLIVSIISKDENFYFILSKVLKKRGSN